MKKLYAISAMLILILLTSCTEQYQPVIETITQEAGNHIYHKGDNIEIIDIATNECIATLCINDYKLLIDSPFSVREYAGKDENGRNLYNYYEYNQLLQISFTFKNTQGYSKTISADNFDVRDKNGSYLDINPQLKDIELDIDYSSSITVATLTTDGYLRLEFTYDNRQDRHTAIIALSEEDLYASSAGGGTASEESGSEESGGTASSSAESDTSLHENSASQGSSSSKESVYVFTIVMLSALVVMLTILLIISYINRRHRL